MTITPDSPLIRLCYSKFVAFSSCILADVLSSVLLCFSTCRELVSRISASISHIHRCYAPISLWYSLHIINFDSIGDLCFCRKVLLTEWYRMVQIVNQRTGSGIYIAARCRNLQQFCQTSLMSFGSWCCFSLPVNFCFETLLVYIFVFFLFA